MDAAERIRVAEWVLRGYPVMYRMLLKEGQVVVEKGADPTLIHGCTLIGRGRSWRTRLASWCYRYIAGRPLPDSAIEVRV